VKRSTYEQEIAAWQKRAADAKVATDRQAAAVVIAINKAAESIISAVKGS
jgi:hypothetical protein